MERWLKIVRANELRDGDLLIIGRESGLDVEAFPEEWPIDFPRVNVLFVEDVDQVKYVQLGRPQGPGPHPGKV